MKLKHVLFSGLFLSATLVACTNDEFAEVQMPSVNAENAIALGEDIIISGTKFAVNADTKAAFDEKFTPYWENDDVVGAAWYNMVTDINEDGTVAENGTSTIEVGSTGMNVFSNHPFAWLEQVGNKYGAKFQANTNVMAGAYILYFPYDETQTQVGKNVPVNLKFPYTINCAEGHEFDAINDHMFSYDEIALVPGGTQTKEFQLHQVPVLYKVQFGFEDLDFVKLLPTMTIEKIIMEAYDKDGESVLSTKGSITPNDKVLTADIYNAYLEDWKKNPLPAAAYATVEEGKVDHYTMDVINSDQANYQLSKLSVGEDGLTAPFYFSTLPFIADKEAATVRFKIVATDGKEEYVFAKTYDATSGVVTAINAENQQYKEEEPAQVALNVRFNTQEQEGVIYTADQFKKAWNAITGPEATLKIGDPIDLSDFDLTNNTNAIINIERRAGASDEDYLISLKSIDLEKADVTFGEGIDVKVAGNVETTGDAALKISGTLSAKEISLGGEADLTLEQMTKLYVAASGEVAATLPTTAEKSGAIEVNRDGKLTLNGGVLSKMTNNGSVTLAGEVSNTGTYWGHMETTSEGKFINEAGATATFVNIVNGNQVVNLENEGATSTKAAGVININANGDYTNEASAPRTRFSISGTNKGIINVNRGVLTEEQGGTLKQEGADARIYVNATENAAGVLTPQGMVSLYEKTGANFGGWIVKNNPKVTVNAVGTSIAYSVKTQEDLLKVGNAGVTNVFIDGAVELSASLGVNIYMNADVTIKNDFTLNNNLHVNGDNVKLINGSNDKAIPVKLDTGSGICTVSGKLVLDKNVTLEATFAKDGSLTRIDATAEGAKVVEK